MKEKMITRTVITTNVSAKVIDLENETVEPLLTTLNFKATAKQAVKTLQHGVGDNKIVKLTGLSYTEKIYGITLTDFMDKAVEITRPASQTKKGDN